MKHNSLYKAVFIPSVLILIAAILCMIIIPEATASAVNLIFTFLTYQFGWLYLLIFVVCSITAVWIGTYRFGRIRLGDEKRNIPKPAGPL